MMIRNRFIAALALLGTALTSPTATAATVELQVDGLVCAFCAQGIEKKLREQPATADVFVSLEKHLVAVALKPTGALSDETLRALLTDAGYTVRSIARTEHSLATIRKQAEAP